MSRFPVAIFARKNQNIITSLQLHKRNIQCTIIYMNIFSYQDFSIPRIDLHLIEFCIFQFNGKQIILDQIFENPKFFVRIIISNRLTLFTTAWTICILPINHFITLMYTFHP